MSAQAPLPPYAVLLICTLACSLVFRAALLASLFVVSVVSVVAVAALVLPPTVSNRQRAVPCLGFPTWHLILLLSSPLPSPPDGHTFTGTQ